MEKITFSPIGIVHSPFKNPQDTPIQTTVSKSSDSNIEIFSEYLDGLKDLDGFSHIIIIFYFHLSNEYSLLVKPHMDNELHGVFSTRSPKRPNPIGFSIVKLNKILKNILFINGIDMVDGTPILDIKPYVNKFDCRENVKIGWLSNNIHKIDLLENNGRTFKKL